MHYRQSSRWFQNRTCHICKARSCNWHAVHAFPCRADHIRFIRDADSRDFFLVRKIFIFDVWHEEYQQQLVLHIEFIFPFLIDVNVLKLTSLTDNCFSYWMPTSSSSFSPYSDRQCQGLFCSFVKAIWLRNDWCTVKLHTFHVYSSTSSIYLWKHHHNHDNEVCITPKIFFVSVWNSFLPYFLVFCVFPRQPLTHFLL